MRELDRADLLHSLFAFLLLFEELPLSSDVSTVALCDNVLSERLDLVGGNDLCAQGGLHPNLVLLSRNYLPKLLDDAATSVVGEVSMHDKT